jgi:hypothetical protein
VFKSYPTLELVSLPTSKLTAGRVTLFRFKVTAGAEEDIGIAKFTFRVATSSATAQLDMIDNANIYVYTDSGFSVAASGVQSDGAISSTNVDLTDHWASASSDLQLWAENSSNASTTVVVPKGNVRYLAIKADALTAGTQFSVSTQLQGDSKFVSNLTATPFKATASTSYLGTTTYIEAQADNDFIWRPFSTTTAQSIDANDYATGYGIPGLPNVNTDTQVMTQ